VRVVVIAGPTGTGKSELAVRLAQSTGGEIVNFDSIQLYRGFDIGSAKPPAEVRTRVPHHLIDVIDPTPTVTDRDVKLVFTDFTRIEVEDGRERSIVLNGTREATRDASVISQRETNFQTVYTFADGHTATSDRTWAITFMADVPGSIQPDAPLPSGTLSVGGTATWTRDANTYSLTVSTDPVLHYNASCTVRPKFDAGTFHATVTRNGTTSNVTIVFSGCGQYTVTRS